MDQASGGKSRVRCPGCERVFEFDEENRGFATRCPKCEMEFMIPEEGMDGVPLDLADDEAGLEINCPHCGTLYVLPEQYRGEVADCAECHGVFTIPVTGDVAVPGTSDAQAADLEEQLSADLPNESPSAAGSSDFRRTATVFLSRKEVMDKAAQGRGGDADRLARPSGIRHQGEPVAGDDDQSAAPVARGVIELNTDPVFEPAHARAVRRSDLPEWMPPMEFEKREKIVEYEEGGEPPLALHKFLTLVPVLLIPLAAGLGTVIHPAMAGAFCFVAGLFFWALHAMKILPPLGRKVIVLTNFRVIMADPREVIDIDLL